jgi:hypothetical protein
LAPTDVLLDLINKSSLEDKTGHPSQQWTIPVQTWNFNRDTLSSCWKRWHQTSTCLQAYDTTELATCTKSAYTRTGYCGLHFKQLDNTYNARKVLWHMDVKSTCRLSSLFWNISDM